MGRKCCVPNCKTGYANSALPSTSSVAKKPDPESAQSNSGASDFGASNEANLKTSKVSLHVFPSDGELRSKWQRSIPRKD